MIDLFCPNPAIAQRLTTGPLKNHIETFVRHRLEQGYGEGHLQHAMRLLADLSLWLQQQPLALTALDEQQVERFLQSRYQRCRPTSSDRPILKQVLEQLRVAKLIDPPLERRPV